MPLLERLYLRWIGAMRSHEAYEEHKLYPYLERRWQRSFSAAEEGHEALHEADEAVRAAFALVEALRRHDAVLREHLIIEEELAIPMLLSLSREEFERYVRKDVRTLMRALDEEGFPSSA